MLQLRAKIKDFCYFDVHLQFHCGRSQLKCWKLQFLLLVLAFLGLKWVPSRQNWKLKSKKWSQNFDWRPCYWVIVTLSYFLCSRDVVLRGLRGAGGTLDPLSGKSEMAWPRRLIWHPISLCRALNSPNPLSYKEAQPSVHCIFIVKEIWLFWSFQLRVQYFW